MLPPELDGFTILAKYHVADLPYERLPSPLLPVAVRVELELAVELVSFQVGHYLVHEILAMDK